MQNLRSSNKKFNINTKMRKSKSMMMKMISLMMKRMSLKRSIRLQWCWTPEEENAKLRVRVLKNSLLQWNSKKHMYRKSDLLKVVETLVLECNKIKWRRIKRNYRNHCLRISTQWFLQQALYKNLWGVTPKWGKLVTLLLRGILNQLLMLAQQAQILVQQLERVLLITKRRSWVWPSLICLLSRTNLSNKCSIKVAVKCPRPSVKNPT